MKIKMNHRFICFVIATVTLTLTLLFTSCSSEFADSETKTETADTPCYHVTVYSPEIEKMGYGSARHPKYTITVEDFNELLPKSYACREQYHLFRIPLEDGRFELVSPSLVEIEYY